MTDKQIVETFRKLKEYCASKKDCGWCRSKRDCCGCRFYYEKNNSGYCQLEEIAWICSTGPKYWNIEEIERIIND